MIIATAADRTGIKVGVMAERWCDSSVPPAVIFPLYRVLTFYAGLISFFKGQQRPECFTFMPYLTDLIIISRNNTLLSVAVSHPEPQKLEFSSD